MSDARFNRSVVFFAVCGWLAWSVDLVIAPRTWWTVLVLSLTVGVLVVCTASVRRMM